MVHYSVNKCVFSRSLKLSLSRSGSLELSGREFQIDAPGTEKARGPSVLIRDRESVNKNAESLADQRCCRAETSDTGMEGL